MVRPEGDILLLQNEINLLKELIGRTYEKGMKIVLNPSPFEEKLLDYGHERVSTFLINETEGMQMNRKESPEDILKELRFAFPNSEVVQILVIRFMHDIRDKKLRISATFLQKAEAEHYDVKYLSLHMLRYIMIGNIKPNGAKIFNEWRTCTERYSQLALQSGSDV